MPKHNVRKKVLLPLSLTLMVLILAFVWASYGIRQKEERQKLRQNYRSVQNVLAGLLDQDIPVLMSTAEFIAGQPNFQTAMLHRNLDRLHADSVLVFERISKQLKITHFYYYDEQGRVLLRVYRPADRSQPELRRKTLQRAMENGRPEAGLEIGHHGFFAQRVVYPWLVDGELTGYIELGMDITSILDLLKQITRIELMIAIDKQYVDRDHWEEGARDNKHRPAWDYLPGKVISDATIDLPHDVAGRIFNEPDYENLENILQVGERTYRAALLPVSDSGNRNIGDLLMLADISDEKVIFRGFLIQVITFSLLLSCALFLFAFRFLGRVGRQLVLSEKLLRQESANLTESNQRLVSEIKERERAEKELVEANQNLEKRVAERTIELAQKNEEIETSRASLERAYQELKEKQATILHQDKMACIGQLAAGIAHDINNPVGFVSHNLVSIERYLQRLDRFVALQGTLIKNRADGDLMAAWEKGRQDFGIAEVFHELPIMLADCRDGTSRISQTVQSLRTFSRNEIPQRKLSDLRQCLDSTLSIMRHQLRGKIEVFRDYGEIPKCYCYPSQLNQVFLNLFINAVQAIEAQGEIRIRTWTEDRQIYISISDNGCGIPQDKLERIFEPFFTTKEIGVGTGLGLSIAYDIITRHQGEIQVQSTVGAGTTFTLRLPEEERSKPRDRPGEAEQPAALNRAEQGPQR